MSVKRGDQLILKESVPTPTVWNGGGWSAPSGCCVRTAYAGDEGKVISRTKNGWLRVRIKRTGAIVTVRNGWARVDKPLNMKIKQLEANTTPCVRLGVSYAWWLPLTPEPWILADRGNQGIWYDHEKGKLMGTEHCEPGGEHILFPFYELDRAMAKVRSCAGLERVAVARAYSALMLLEKELMKEDSGRIGGPMGPKEGSSYTGD